MIVRVIGLLIALGLSQGVIAAEPEAAKGNVRVAEKPPSAKTKIRFFRTGDGFKIFLAAFSDHLAELRAKKEPTPTDIAKIAQLQNQMREVLMTYEQVVRVAPIVGSLSIQFGAEIPLPILSRLPGMNKIPATPGVQGSTGVTIVMTEDGTTNAKKFSFAWSFLAGGNMTLGRRHEQLQKGTGYNGIAPALVVLLPLSEDMPSLTLGDLQGVYFGAAGEVSTPTSDRGISHILSAGAYVRPHMRFALPDAALFYFFHGLAGETSRPSGQGEALWYSLLASQDGSSFRNPVPWWNDSSEHSEKSRRAATLQMQDTVGSLTSEDLLERAKKAQVEIELKLDAQR